MDSDEDMLASNDKPPSIDVIMQQFSNTSINNSKKKENYKLKICDYPRTFNNLMKEKNLSYADLWEDVDPDEANEEILREILQKFDLKFSLEAFDNNDNCIIILSINSEPVFSMAKTANTTQEAIPSLVGEALKFLKIMTAQ